MAIMEYSNLFLIIHVFLNPWLKIILIICTIFKTNNWITAINGGDGAQKGWLDEENIYICKALCLLWVHKKADWMKKTYTYAKLYECNANDHM
jgi:hypothetical protein